MWTPNCLKAWARRTALFGEVRPVRSTMGGRRGPRNIMPFPILIENTEAIGELRGQSIRVSTLAATSLLLASRGADKILLPTPSSGDRLIAERGLLALPPERRAAVQLVDQ